MSDYEIRKKVVSEIVEQFNPMAIYGLPGVDVPDQDQSVGLNILVVLETQGSRAAQRRFRPKVDSLQGFSMDFHFLTLEEFESSRNTPGRVAYLAAQKGSLLYERKSPN